MRSLQFLLPLCGVLLTSSLARADVHLFSVLAGEVQIRYGPPGGTMREASLGSMQEVSLSGADPVWELTVQDEQGARLYQGSLANHRYWVLGPGKKSPAALTEVGATQVPHPLKAVAFYNANNYPVILEMFALKGEEALVDVQVGAHEAAGPYQLAEGTFKLYLKDEGGNPIGQSYSYVNPGRFYLVYRKRATLYDVVKLGEIPSGK
jgi:hypothetical protein